MFIPQIKKEELSIRNVADRWLDYYYDDLPTGFTAQARGGTKLRKVMNHIRELIDDKLLKADIEVKEVTYDAKPTRPMGSSRRDFNKRENLWYETASITKTKQVTTTRIKKIELENYERQFFGKVDNKKDSSKEKNIISATKKWGNRDVKPETYDKYESWQTLLDGKYDELLDAGMMKNILTKSYIYEKIKNDLSGCEDLQTFDRTTRTPKRKR